MASDDRIKAIERTHPRFIPANCYMLPATWAVYREALEDVLLRHPALFPDFKRGVKFDDIGGRYAAGEHVDEWGCVWTNIRTGCDAMVKKHPVPTREAVHKLKPPAAHTGFPHGFMYLRLSDLRGFDEIMIDFAEEPPELQMLIDIVLGHNLRELDEMLKKPLPEIVTFGDDLGMQTSLPVSPEKWRKYLKPCFARIYRPIRERGSYIHMHTDGHIIEIIPDLVDCGVSVVNPQIRANGLDNLARVCKGKVCVNLDLDRQLFPFCSPRDIDEHVREAVAKLGSPEGGLWLVAECGPDVPLENIDAICCALEKYRAFFS